MPKRSLLLRISALALLGAAAALNVDWGCSANGGRSADATAVTDADSYLLGSIPPFPATPVVMLWDLAPNGFVSIDSTTAPTVNTGDFTCFLQQYSAAVQLPAAGQQTHYANCDGSTTFPQVNTGDFTCFLQKYAAGCSV